jgi:hypothetical protein
MAIQYPPTGELLHRIQRASANCFYVLDAIIDDARLEDESRSQLKTAAVAVEAIQEHLGRCYDFSRGELTPKERAQ